MGRPLARGAGGGALGLSQALLLLLLLAAGAAAVRGAPDATAAKQQPAPPAADAVCASFGPPPRVAVCLAGGARTLPHELARATLRDNVLRAFGGRQTIFAAQIKLGDARGDARARYGATLDAAEGAARAALAGLTAGSGGDGMSAQAELAELALERSAAPEPLADCEGYTRYGDRGDSDPIAGGAGNTTSAAEGVGDHEIANKTPEHFRTAAYLQSFLGQLRGNAECMRMVEAHEARHGLRFDWVLKLRPDLAVARALKPSCFWDPRVVHQRNDYIYIAPRDLAPALLAAPRVAYYGCDRDYNSAAGREGHPGVLALEQWIFARAAEAGARLRETGQEVAAAPLRPLAPGFPDVLCKFVAEGSYAGAVALFVDGKGRALPHRPDLLQPPSARDAADRASYGLVVAAGEGDGGGASNASHAPLMGPMVAASAFCRAVLNHNPANAPLTPPTAIVPPAPDALCGAFHKPRVAVCLSGGARTLPHTLARATLRDNVVRAFGGDATLFAYLKLRDRRGDDRPGMGEPVHTEAAAARAALEEISAGANAAIGTLVLDKGQAGDPGGRLLTPPAACTNYTRYGAEAVAAAQRRNAVWMAAKKARRGNATSAEKAANAPPEGADGRFKSVAYLDSFLGQLHNNERCLAMVEEHEERHGIHFDWVVKLRPDLAVVRPLKPFCFWDASRVHHRNDWLYLAPRALAAPLLRAPLREYEACRRNYNSARGADGPVEQWLFSTLDSMGVPRAEMGREAATAVLRPLGRGHPDNLLCAPAAIERGGAAGFGGAIERERTAEGAPHRPDLPPGELCRRVLNHNPTNSAP